MNLHFASLRQRAGAYPKQPQPLLQRNALEARAGHFSDGGGIGGTRLYRLVARRVLKSS